MSRALYWLLVSILGLWTLYSLFFFTFFWYEAVNGRYWEKLGKRYSINLKIFAIRSILSSVFNLARVWFYWPTRYFPRFWVLPDNHPAHVPVVFVHGYLHNRSAWIKYFKWMKKEGFTHLLAIDLKGKFKEIEKYAEQLSVEVDQLLKRYGVNRVDIVAHSMGGLVSRYYIQVLGGKKKVRKCVTLGSPHNGTKVAVFVVGKSRQQMLPGSDFLDKIEITDSKSLGKTRLNVLYSDSDFMIVPTNLGKVIAKGAKNECVGLVSHIGFIYNRGVYKKVLSVLAKG